MKWLFALRYLISRSFHSVINIIAAVSLVSVAIPVAAMVILLSVFNGFEGVVKELYAERDADIEISGNFDTTDSLKSRILSVEGVSAASFVIEGEVIARTKDRESSLSVKGVDSSFSSVLPIAENIVKGSDNLTLGEIDYAIITSDVAQKLGVYTTALSRVKLYSLKGATVGSLLPVHGISSCQLHIGGIIKSSQQLKGCAIIPLRVAEHLFGERSIKKIMINCSDDINRVQKRLIALDMDGVKIETRAEKNALFYQIMRYEKWAVFFVALLVLIIASLSIIGTVIMLIVEKRDEQTTLLSIGADSEFIRGIFIREGLLISGIGGTIGLMVGIIVVLLQEWFGFIRMPNSAFVVDSYPVDLQAADLIMIFITFVAIAWTVSHIAARTMIKR